VLAANGVEIGLGEGFVVRSPGAGSDVFVPGDDNMRGRWAADMEIMAELGIPIVNAVCLDEDFSRGLDQLGQFADLAAANSMTATIEFCPGFGAVRDLPTALRAVDHVGGNLRLLLDPMHLIRSGGCIADIAAIDPALISYAQLCDVPIEPPHDDYLEEAMNERVAPGEGELPLTEFVAALPQGVTVSLEVPQKRLAEAGAGPRARLTPVVAAARDLLARAGG
jgi:sugar phosphate isomerase/epimerase